MYDRQLEDRLLTFGVSGKTWNRSLIMYDSETKTEWSHILGLAMKGELKGRQLIQIPSVMTDWETWKKNHPETDVLWLSLTDQEFKKEFYSIDTMKHIVLGISAFRVPHAWRLDTLARKPVINQRIDDRPVLITFDESCVTARMFSRTLDGTTLDFELQGNGDLVDSQSNSRWNLLTGKCLSGQFVGKNLNAMPAFLSYIRAWKKFHPNTKIWPADILQNKSEGIE